MADRHFLLADVGGTHLRTAIGSDDSGLAGKLHGDTRVELGPDGVMRQIADMSRQSLQQAGIAPQSVAHMVVAAPGPLDPKTGVVIEAPNMPGWMRVELTATLSGMLGMPVDAVNDANAAALGEFHFGAGRGARTMVYLTVSTGIGGGVIVDGRLMEGSDGMAGELGHMTIDLHGPLCPCGNIGCLEVLASGTSIGRIFRERLAAGGTSVVTQWTDRATGADVTRAAGLGDPLAVEVFAQAATALGVGVVNAVNIFNPEVVVLGGGVTQAGDRLFEPVRDMVRQRALPVSRDDVRVLCVELGDDAGLSGTLAIARQLADRAVPVDARSPGGR